MIRRNTTLFFVFAALWNAAARADEPVGGKHLLRYKFQPGETLRWRVEHQAQVRTTVGGSTQTADTFSGSIKVWEVTDVDDDGCTTFVHSVESVDMRQKLTGRQETTFNSQTDAVPPPGFEDVAKDVGVALSVIRIDPSGKVLERQQKRDQPNVNQGPITIPLPAEAVAIGHEWSLPYDIQVSLQNGTMKKIQARNRFRLADVKDGVATIEVTTQVLTPVNDPAIEAQLVQHASDGQVRFDMEQGRVTSQQTDLDRRVVGFQGDASSLHYQTRFSERLMPAGAATAARPVGPMPPAR